MLSDYNHAHSHLQMSCKSCSSGSVVFCFAEIFLYCFDLEPKFHLCRRKRAKEGAKASEKEKWRHVLRASLIIDGCHGQAPDKPNASEQCALIQFVCRRNATSGLQNAVCRPRATDKIDRSPPTKCWVYSTSR